jgi:hypothetical protein
MHALDSKVLAVVVFALVMAIAIHSSVYLSIDAASLTAEMPDENSPAFLVRAVDRQQIFLECGIAGPGVQSEWRCPRKQLNLYSLEAKERLIR